MTSYDDFQNASNSEKIGLVTLDAAIRVMGWEVHSGSVYKRESFPHQVITKLAEGSTELTAAVSIAAITAGKYFLDRSAQILYMRATDSSNPNGKFIAATFRNFFSNVSVIAPHDLDSAFDVEWLPLVKDISEFGVELERGALQLGAAVEGSGSVKFYNQHTKSADNDFWQSRFDKWYFDNKLCFIYSWSREIPITEAKLIYRGKVQGKTYSQTEVGFSLKDVFNELRGEPDIADIIDLAGVKVNSDLERAKQRRIYGTVFGHKPTNIDQLVDDLYPLAGTVSINTGTTTVTGIGTSFFNDFSPGDEIRFQDIDDDFQVVSITSDTSLEISDNFPEPNISGKTYQIRPEFPKRYINRIWLVAGHATKEPATTVTNGITSSRFFVGNTDGFRAGDVIKVGSEVTTISQINGNLIRVSVSLINTPANGAAVTKASVSNVKINNNLLVQERDFTYNATTAKLTLDPLAEFNIARTLSVLGTSVTFNSTRTVTGSGTFFLNQLKIGDWIRLTGQASFFEIGSIQTDTSLTLRQAATYSGTGAGFYKDTANFDPSNNDVLSLDVIGRTEDGTKTGTFFETGPEIVKDILTEAGLSDLINTASFNTAKLIAPQRMGFVIPARLTDSKPIKFRDMIQKVNQSIFGVLFQNPDFELEYSVMDPERAVTRSFDESDILKFTIKSDGSQISKQVDLTYAPKEFDAPSATGPLFSVASSTSNPGTFLAESNKVFTHETVLSDQRPAEIMAGRIRQFLSYATSEIQFNTKLQGARLKINDVVQITHEKLYERVGTNRKSKIASVQGSKKSFGEAAVSIDDLANMFSRTAAITRNDAADFSNASADEKMTNGYLTDTFGLIDNDPETEGVNLIA